MRHEHFIGAAAELYVATRLMQKNWEIFFPVTTQSRCDFVAYTPDIHIGGETYLPQEPVKVQVKKATWNKVGKSKYLQVRIHNGKTTHYARGDWDFLAITDMDRVWMLDWDTVQNLNLSCIHLDKISKNPRAVKRQYNPDVWLI